MARLILDSGAVIALAAREPRARAFVRRSSENGDLIVVPAVVIAETTRGNPRDAPVNLVLKAINQVALVTEQTARMAGRLQGQAEMSATVDALIVAEAVLGGPTVVLTGDVDHLAKLVVGYDHVRIYAVSDV